jgi:tRNA-specific 2-thiouridylase
MKIVVGLSGGVDSSVAAYLLKQQGHDVVGLFMRNWNDASVTLEDECPWIEDSNDALMVAQKLGIPFQVIDMSELYKERIVDYMFEEYEKGRTPNPDVLCNREVSLMPSWMLLFLWVLKKWLPVIMHNFLL